MFPVALIIGTIGYNIERSVSDRYTPSQGKSIDERRQERMMQEINQETDPSKVESLKDHTYVPGAVFTKNVSPSLVSSSKIDK